MEKDTVVFKIAEMHVYSNIISDYYQVPRTFFSHFLQFKVYICIGAFYLPLKCVYYWKSSRGPSSVMRPQSALTAASITAGACTTCDYGSPPG